MCYNLLSNCAINSTMVSLGRPGMTELQPYDVLGQLLPLERSAYMYTVTQRHRQLFSRRADRADVALHFTL
jgi:hypothetical protein